MQCLRPGPVITFNGFTWSEGAVGFPWPGPPTYQADAHYTRVVRDEWNLEDLTFIFTFCNRTWNEEKNNLNLAYWHYYKISNFYSNPF